MKKVTVFMWFNDQAEEAARFYVSLFKGAKVTNISRRGPGKKAPVMSASFTIDGQDFVAFNGGDYYKFSPATSIYIDCKTQAEVDRLWKAFSKGGSAMQCGWITDRFGVTWQVIPDVLPKLIGDQDPVKAGRAMAAMMEMVKIDIKALKAAHAGKARAKPST